MLHNLIKGLDLTLGNWTSVSYLLGASIFGMISGILPGLGGPVILSITLALIFHIPLTGVLCIFLAIHAASFFTSSITAILLNTPQHAESFAVTFDGFPMAQRGEAGRALGISAASTCIGGFVGCACLIGFIQIINYLPNLFHPPEYVALITIALLLVATLGTDAASKAVMSVGLGLIIATIGQDQDTGAFRFTFNAVGLSGGVGLVSMALGAFAIPQMVLLFGVSDRVARQDMTGREIGKVAPAEIGQHFGRQVIEGILETCRHWVVCVLSGLIGVLTGLIPGIGAFAANFMSYGLIQQTSKKRALFGTGIAEGIIAPEGSSLSKEAGGMVPLLGLGIPGGVAGALFLAALSIKGLRPGFGFTATNPEVAYEIVWIIAFGGLIGTLIGVLAAPYLARVTRIPGPCLVPIILSLAVVGAYSTGPSFFLVMEVPIFALIGFVFRRLRYAVAVLVIALVLGPTYEDNIYLTHQIYLGWSFLDRPFADVLGAIAVAMLVLKVRQQRRETRKEKAVLEELVGEERLIAEHRYLDTKYAYPFLGLVTTTLMFMIGMAAALYALFSLGAINAIMPTFGGFLAVAGALFRLPGDMAGYRRYRQKREVSAAGAAQSSAVGLPGVPQSALAGTSSLERGAGGVMTLGTDNLTDYRAGIASLVEPLQASELAAVVPETAGEPGRYPEIAVGQWGWHGQYSREFAAFAWFAGLIAAVWFCGFYVSLPAFGLAYSLFGTRRTFESILSRVVFGAFIGAFGWVQAFLIFRLLHINFTPVLHFLMF